ncbi:hypothetical protein AB751O23_BO_00050 [Chlamydiales bacterium SCGC AB-751-O23]|nr:hypothetical protein AB751O23_BO_00050 [Chlamydiales bacterium SCGC AB-751-O23]
MFQKEQPGLCFFLQLNVKSFKLTLIGKDKNRRNLCREEGFLNGFLGKKIYG